jgi:hypothetical protein
MTDESREGGNPTASADATTKKRPQGRMALLVGRRLDDLTAWVRKRLALAIVLAVLLGLSIIFLGVWKLPEWLVNEDLYNRRTQRVEMQEAYNAARTPVGVVLAGTLAAVAAGLGVLINHRNVALGREQLKEAQTKDARDREQYRDDIKIAGERDRLDREQYLADVLRATAKDQADREQWREEQYAKRFQDAARMLGDDKAAVRLAGVYAMEKVSFDWQDQRQTCVDVLAAYLRLPWPSAQIAEEVGLRQTIGKRLVSILDTDSESMVLDLTGAELRRFEVRYLKCGTLSLDNALLVDSHVHCIARRGSFRGLKIAGETFVQLNGEYGTADSWHGPSVRLLSGRGTLYLHIPNGHEKFNKKPVYLGGIVVESGAELLITVQAEGGNPFELIFRDIEVRGQLHTSVFFDELSPSSARISMSGSVEDSGTVGVRAGAYAGTGNEILSEVTAKLKRADGSMYIPEVGKQARLVDKFTSQP